MHSYERLLVFIMYLEDEPMVRVSCRAVQTSADQRRQLESSDVL